MFLQDIFNMEELRNVKQNLILTSVLKVETREIVLYKEEMGAGL